MYKMKLLELHEQFVRVFIPLLQSLVLLASAKWKLWFQCCRSMFYHPVPCVLSMGSSSAIKTTPSQCNIQWFVFKTGFGLLAVKPGFESLSG